MIGMTYNQIRMEICKECDRFNPMLKICKECGCFMPGKVLMKSVRCPINKWIEISSIKEKRNCCK